MSVINGKQVAAATTTLSGVLTAAAQSLFGNKLFDTLAAASTRILALKNNVGTKELYVSSASPEGSITAGPGSTCSDVVNGKLYVKASGVGNTGWVDQASILVGSTSGSAGASGHVPVPAANTMTYQLHGDGTFQPSGRSNFLSLTNFAAGGSVGTAAATVDAYNLLAVVQTTAGQVLTMPSPTLTTYYRDVRVYNGGTAAFTLNGMRIAPLCSFTFSWSPVSSAWFAINVPTGSGTAAVGTTFGTKMVLAAASATATITANEATLGSAVGSFTYRLASMSFAINLATVGANGMDIGTATANNFVSVYAIFNPTTGLSAALCTLAATSSAPTYTGANLPAGYTQSCLLAIFPTSGTVGQFKAGSVVGRQTNIAPVTLIAASTTARASYFSQALNVAVPPGAVSWSAYATVQSSAFANSTLNFAADSVGSGAQQVGAISNNGAASIMGSTGSFTVPVSTSQTAFYTAITGSGTITYSVFVTSYAI